MRMAPGRFLGGAARSILGAVVRPGGIAMPMLNVRCVKCKRWIPTGLDMDYETFRSQTYFERTIECTVCEGIQTWNLDDVDRSVFRGPAKPGA